MARERTFAPAQQPESAGTAAAGPERGRPLDTAIRVEMERGFGERFGDVRVHDDPSGGQSAQRMGARAYTYGRDVYFAPGAYQPDAPAGRRLLAHELAHVIQQRQGQRSGDSQDQGASSGGGPAAGQPIAAAEREADAAAETVAQGGTARVTRGSVRPQIQPTLYEITGNDDFLLIFFSIASSDAGNFAEVPIIRNYVAQRGEDGVYLGPVHPGNLPLASFLALTEMDRIPIARIIRGKRPDVLDTRTKEVWDVKPRNHQAAAGVLDEYINLLQELYDEYEAYRPRAFDVARPTYLNAAYRHGQHFPFTKYMLRPFLWVVAEQEAPGVVEYYFLADDSVFPNDHASQLGLVKELQQERKATLATQPLRGRPPEQPNQPRSPRGMRIRVRLSPRAVEFDATGKEQPGDTIKVTATKDSRRILPGLEFGRATLILGEELTPVGGSLTAVATLPFAKDRSHELTFTVDTDGHAAVTFDSVLKLGALGEVEIHAAMEHDLLTARADVTPQPAFLRNVHGQLLYQEGELSGGLTFTPDGLALPIPGLTAENVSGAITFTTDSIAGEGMFTLRYQGLGQADIALRYDKKGLDLDGTLNVTVPGLEPVTGTVAYKAGKLTAETHLTKAHFPAGLPLESGSITIRLVDGEIEGSGKLGVTLGPVGKGNLTFGYANGMVEIGAGIDLEVPGLRGGTVLIRYADGQLTGEGSIPLDTDLLPGLGGNLQVWYREGRFGAETALSYRRGDLQGGVTLRLEQLEDGSLAISGGGEVSAKIAPWLTGRVQVEITRDAAINIHGEIKAPDEIELFPRKAIKQEKTFPRIEFPLFGISVPVVGSIGIIGFIEAGGGFELFAGPAVLRNITVAGAFGIDGNPVSGAPAPDGTSPGGGAIGPSFDISGELAMSAGAEVYMFVEGGISLDAAVADISGSIRLRGGLGAVATLGVVPHIGYENGEYYFKGDAELAALAFLRLSGSAQASVSVAVYGEVWGDSWPLFEWVYPLGLNVGMKGRMEYYFGRPFEPNFELQTEELDPLAVVKSAFPDTDSKPSGGPSTPPEPRTSMTTDMVPGARSGDGGPVSAPPPAGAAMAALPSGPPGRGGPAPRPPTQTGSKVPPPLPPRRAPGTMPPAVSAPPAQPPSQRPPGVPSPIPTRPRPPAVPPPIPTTPPPVPATPQSTVPPIIPPTTPNPPLGPGQLPPTPPPTNLRAAILPGGFRVPSDRQPTATDTVLTKIYGGPGYYGTQFTMQVDFDPNHPEVPNLEYQQWVTGLFGRQKRGQSAVRIVRHELPDGSALSPGSVARDGAAGTFYGDRTRTYVGFLDDHYYDGPRSENRTSGSRYRGWDAPGIRFDPATDQRVEVDLTFLGLIVHTTSKTIVESRRWTVKGELDV